MGVVKRPFDDCPERYPERLKRFWAMPGAHEHNPATGQVGPFEEIAGYRLLRLLGYGGFAHTFLAEKDGAQFALKLLNELPSGPAATRFEREVEALQLEHRNLVRYEDSGIASYGGLTRPYIAMPYVPGATLRDWIDSAPRSLPPDRLRAIGAEVADGLAFLHDHNVAHRDLTPKNVFLTEAGGVLIIDFGLARLQDRTSLTLKGQMLGTLAYCSPEQLRNETDLHTDLYGLGATLYHALTGQPPFEATSLPALVEMIRSEVPEPPSLRNPSVPDDLDDLVLALLAKEPVQRPTSALAVAESLRTPAGRRARSKPYESDSPAATSPSSTGREPRSSAALASPSPTSTARGSNATCACSATRYTPAMSTTPRRGSSRLSAVTSTCWRGERIGSRSPTASHGAPRVATGSRSTGCPPPPIRR